MTCLSLWGPPPAKSISFSPRTYLLPRQTQSVVPQMYRTKLRENMFICKCNGGKYTDVRSAGETQASDEGEDAPQAAKQQQRVKFWTTMSKYLRIEPGSPMGVAVVVLMHFLCLFAPFCFSWDAVGLALGLYSMTMLGSTLSYHRNLSHRSFKLPKWLEYFFAYWGVHALQGDPINWVSNHRYHHLYADTENDPHTPIKGFWYSHMGWLYDSKAANERSSRPTNVGDLENQFFYKFIRNTYIIHPTMLAILLYVVGGFPYIVWGMGIRTVFQYQVVFLLNSLSHTWGNQAWNTGDQSRNNWFLALLAHGDGWHNNHHAFEFSARHGLEWWELDLTWGVVRALQTLGMASDVKLPTDAQKNKMSFNNSMPVTEGHAIK